MASITIPSQGELYSSVIDFEAIIPRIKTNNPEYWEKMSIGRKLWEYRIAYFDYKWTARDIQDARNDFWKQFDNKDPLEIEFDIYQASSDSYKFCGFYKYSKWHAAYWHFSMVYDYKHSPFYCKDKIILKGKELKTFKQAIKDMMFETFDSSTRAFKFPQQSPFGRCLYCSRRLIDQKWKPKNYCRKQPNGKVSYCGTNFNIQYSWQPMRWYIARRDNFTCKECGIVDPEKWEIDHIVEIATGKTNYEKAILFTDPENMQFLCNACHKKKTAEFLSKWLSMPKKEKKKKPKKQSKNLENYL